jgi:hypothetical protein
MAERENEQEAPPAEDGYKVTDRRLFTAEGELRAGAAREKEREEERKSTQAPPPAARERSSAGEGFERRPLDEPEGVDFTMLINAMAEPALLFLGEIPHPATGKAVVDLERSRLQIDMLDLLRVKCRGNLTHEEEALLDRILYQLRMLYVARANQPAP